MKVDVAGSCTRTALPLAVSGVKAPVASRPMVFPGDRRVEGFGPDAGVAVAGDRVALDQGLGHPFAQDDPGVRGPDVEAVGRQADDVVADRRAHVGVQHVDPVGAVAGDDVVLDRRRAEPTVTPLSWSALVISAPVAVGPIQLPSIVPPQLARTP